MGEINVTAYLIVSKGNLTESFTGVGSYDFVASQPAVAAGVATIGFAAHEAIPMGDVTTAGWAVFKNVSAANYVEIGTDVAAAFVPSLKLKPAEQFAVRLGTNAPYAKANTAAVQLQYRIYQD